MFEKLYPYRFELFLLTQTAILFGSLAIPLQWFEITVLPVLHIVNVIAGLVLVHQKKILFRVLTVVFVVIVLNLFFSAYDIANYSKLIIYFLFHGLLTLEIIRQVWNAKVIGKNVILGLISGYISLGLLAFFICMSIEVLYPNSFSGLVVQQGVNTDISEQLMYYAYITLMTIGYGDILPVTTMAQKASIFIGLIGQFYLVILTAIVVGKYINQQSNNT